MAKTKSDIRPLTKDQLQKLIVDFDKNVSTIDEGFKSAHELREEFVNIFTREKLSSMTLNDYCIGAGNKTINNFCYGIERVLDPFGRILGRTSNKFGVWYSKGGLTMDSPYNKYGTPKKAFQHIKDDIVALYDAGEKHDLTAIEENEWDDWLKAKFLHIYYPEQYIGIYSHEVVMACATLLGVYDEEVKGFTFIRDAIANFKKKNTITKDWSMDAYNAFLWELNKNYESIMKDIKVDIEEEYRYFLTYCVKNSSSVSTLSETTIDNYISGLKGKVFEYAQKYKPDLESIYDINTFKGAQEILMDGVLADSDFIKKNKGIWKNMYTNALFQYCCFLRAREFFIGHEPITKVIESISEFGPIQQIFYGAPGTGKSHTVKETTDTLPKGNVFRTTFHPDSDYSTFIGAYKPTTTHKELDQTILDYDGLVDRLKKYISDLGNITHASAMMGYNYHDSIVRMQENGTHTIQDLLTDAYRSKSTYDTTIRSGMMLYEEQLNKGKSATQITYEYVPQAFLKAYVRAYQTSEPVFLVIEEINRGNCAQVFGDMFQLLDRNEDGVSDYAVKPDTDIEKYLKKELGDLYKPEDGMRLPNNLYIWATMNTSDQSLFPIDSAFKRRWDWVYVPIEKGKDKGTDTELDWKIVMDDGTETDWWDFLLHINAVISNLTSSADKQLGFFFCKAKDGKIDQKTFVNKVLFYLWNDVFKDYAEDGNPIFKYKHETPEGKTEEVDLTFPDFFKYNDAPQAFVDNVLNWDKDNK